MRQSRLATAPGFAPAPDIRRMIARNAMGVAGIAVLLAVACITIALATWSVTDPSLSHATSATAHNRLGYAGAVIADLAMQLIGLASAIALLPAMATGWRMLMKGRHGITQWRLIWWAVGTLSAATALASFSLPAGWPLPVGLGGVIGDMIMRMPIALMGNQDTGRLIGGLAFGALAFFALLTAVGAGASSDHDDDEQPGRIDAESFSERDAEEGGMFALPMAILHHWILVGRANLLRLLGLRGSSFDARPYGMSGGRSRRAASDRASLDDDEYATPARRVVVRGRQEPGFDRPQARVRVATPPVVHEDEEDDDDYLAAEVPSSYAPTKSPPVREPRREPEFDPDYMPPNDYEEIVPDFEPMPERPSRVAQPTRQEPTGGMVGSDQRRIAVGAQPKPILQEKRPGGRMEVQGSAPHGYQMPSLGFLSEPRRLGPNEELSEEVLEGNAGVLEGVLDDFGIKGEICHVRPGPVVTLYELEPAAGVKSSRVIGLADDIARSMSAISARVAVVPGRNVIGIELPNQRRETVYLRELLASTEFGATKHKLALCLGKTIGGEPVIVDLARMPHLLVAGTTGSGKSVAINTMILSLLYRLTPQQCKLIMIDPKMLELSVYDNIPHLLCPVVTDPKKAVVALKWSVREMEDRYKKMSKLGVRNIDGFNARVSEANARGEILTREVQTGFHRLTGEPIFEQEELALEPLPYIVVIVDEMADLMLVAGKEIEGAIQRLAQMARAAGIHIVMATQRPSVDVITGTIKANFPTRISFQVTSKIDSRTILAEQGAEQLLGQGDMLYMAGGGRIQRVHGPFVSDDEVEKVVAHLKKQGAPQYLDAITAGDEDDVQGEGDAGGLDESSDLYDKAVAVVLRDKKPSTSYVQRRLQIGYNRAASLIERMEKEGILSAPNQQGKREILVGGG